MSKLGVAKKALGIGKSIFKNRLTFFNEVFSKKSTTDLQRMIKRLEISRENPKLEKDIKLEILRRMPKK